MGGLLISEGVEMALCKAGERGGYRVNVDFWPGRYRFCKYRYWEA
jgi:hypothetical protein